MRVFCLFEHSYNGCDEWLTLREIYDDELEAMLAEDEESAKCDSTEHNWFSIQEMEVKSAVTKGQS